MVHESLYDKLTWLEQKPCFILYDSWTLFHILEMVLFLWVKSIRLTFSKHYIETFSFQVKVLMGCATKLLTDVRVKKWQFPVRLMKSSKSLELTMVDFQLQSVTNMATPIGVSIVCPQKPSGYFKLSKFQWYPFSDIHSKNVASTLIDLFLKLHSSLIWTYNMRAAMLQNQISCSCLHHYSIA